MEDQLWYIFTYYAIKTNPHEPCSLPCIGFERICRDCQILDSKLTENVILIADIRLLFISTIKSHSIKAEKLHFDSFIDALSKLSQKCYPRHKLIQDSMHQLLLDNIFPFCQQRNPVSVVEQLNEIQHLLKYYNDAFTEIFSYYSHETERRIVDRKLLKSTAKLSLTSSKVEVEKTKDTSRYCMEYLEFIKFCSDYGLSTSIGLTQIDLADIYLSTLDSKPTMKKRLDPLNYEHFSEIFVRVSMSLFKDYAEVSLENKFKAMIHSITIYLHTTQQSKIPSRGAINGKGIYNSFTGGLITGAKLLSDKFLKAWSHDNKCNYLEVPIVQCENVHSSVNSNVFSKIIDKRDQIQSRSHLNTSEAIQVNNQTVLFDIGDLDNLGDDRINPIELKKLFKLNPEIAAKLYKCLLEENII